MENEKQSKRSSKWLSFATVGILALLLAVGALWWLFPDGEADEAAIVTESAETVSTVQNPLPPQPTAGHPAPDFTLTTLEGEAVSLSDFRGQPVIVNFWASWCGPCRLEMPHLQETHSARQADGVVVLGVNLTERENNTADVEAFLDEFGVSFPVVLDEEGDVARLYEVRGQPASVFIDPDGDVQTVFYGPVNQQFIDERVDEMLAS